jgi:hypothetical protein
LVPWILITWPKSLAYQTRTSRLSKPQLYKTMQDLIYY